MKANEVIFNIGDVGDYFYILIHGRVQLFLPNPDIQNMNRQISQLQADLAQDLTTTEDPMAKEKMTDTYKIAISEIEKQRERLPPLVKAIVIEPVRSFGERSLLRDLPRAGTT